MRLVIDCDDAAENLKPALYEHAKALGYEIDDLAYQKTHDCDYPDVAFNLARKVAAGEYDRGILVCGTGLGVALCANKVQGAYAGTCHDVFSAERLKKSNDANIITMGERVIGVEHAKKVLEAFLDAKEFQTKSQRKVDRMRELEAESFGKK